MTKKIRELMSEAEAKQAEAKTLLESGDLDGAEKALNDGESIAKQIELAKRIETTEKSAVAEVEPKVETSSVKAFANAARHGFKSAMNEGVGTEGGYTVPEDILTQIEHYREAKFSLRDLVTIVPVKTNSGARTFKKRVQQTGFTKVGEGAKIGEMATPTFERLEYKISKYGGYFPVTNELLEDSDAAIVTELVQWAGDESRVTANNLILNAIKAGVTAGTVQTATISSLDDIKKAVNATLGQAYKGGVKVITNDDGLNWLDTLKDAQKRYILQPDPQNPMQLRICAGATVIPVDVVPNADMPSDGTNVPFYIGDLKEAVAFFDRRQLTLKQSDTASVTGFNAFEEDLTLIRAIEREDVQLRDVNAVVVGTLSLA